MKGAEARVRRTVSVVAAGTVVVGGLAMAGVLPWQRFDSWEAVEMSWPPVELGYPNRLLLLVVVLEDEPQEA